MGLGINKVVNIHNEFDCGVFVYLLIISVSKYLVSFYTHLTESLEGISFFYICQGNWFFGWFLSIYDSIHKF